MDGWNMEKLESLNDVLEDLNRMKYEIDGCRRGSFTGCKTYAELSELLHELSERLDECASLVENIEEDECEDEEA